MKKRMIGWVGMGCGVLFLTGCYNQEKILTMQDTQAGLTEEMQALSKRVKALEKSVWEVRNELAAAQVRTEEVKVVSTNQESEDAMSGSPDGWLKKGPKEDYTPDVLNRLVGMSAEKLTQSVGQPDKQATLDKAEYWTYANFSYKGTNGAMESAAVQVVLENGRVTRATFISAIHYEDK